LKIERHKAKELLAGKQAEVASEQEKAEILEEYWIYDSEEALEEAIKEEEFPQIEPKLLSLIATTAKAPSPMPSGLEPLIEHWKRFKLEKVLNRFIEEKLKEFGLTFAVTGDIEAAGLCPCCLHYSIEPGEDGLWDICPVCFWENGGAGPNHMSLEEAQANFKSMGAMSRRCLEFIDPEGPLKYAKHCPNQAPA